MIKKNKFIDNKDLSLIILDRDGVINKDSNSYIKSSEEFKIISSSIEAIKFIYSKNIPLAIATNQSGIGRGLFKYCTLKKIHSKLLRYLENKQDIIKHIAICPHHPNKNCNCRKPKIGLLKEISNKLKIPLNKSVYFVGDRIKDAKAAINAGCTPILVKTGQYKEKINIKYKKKITLFKNLKYFAKSIK